MPYVDRRGVSTRRDGKTSPFGVWYIPAACAASCAAAVDAYVVIRSATSARA